MEVYEYKGRNKHGDIMQGTVDAPNAEGVVNWMMASGISPIHVQLKQDPLKDQPAWIQALQGTKKLNDNDLLMLTRQMGTLMKAGVPMIQAVNGLKTSSRNPSMANLLRSLHASLDKGSELSVAMSRHPDFFNEYYTNMIRVGESSGKLDEVFNRLFMQLDFDRRMRQKIKGVLRYPSFVMIAIVIAMFIMTIFVIPSFTKVYTGMHIELPAMTLFLISVSSFASKNWMLILTVVAMMIMIIRYYVSTPEGLYNWDKYKLKIPVVGSVLTKATTARFCRSFETAMKSGVPIVTAFTLVSRVVDNSFYWERILLMRDAVSHGDSLLRSFQSAGIFSPMELQMIAVGEETGDVEGMVQQLATLYQEEVEYEAGQLTETLEPILLVFMAGLVLILLLGIFLPMWNMTQLVH
jgi:MSHA biogenesis protein MshG